MVRPNDSNGHSKRSPEDVRASILVDMAEVARLAPKVLPEDFGPNNRYRLEELIGVGRDSHVYKAVDRHLSKPNVPAYVAIKVRGSQDGTRVEALVGRSVLHDNVVRVIDHGVTENDEPYMVQEWIAEGDLGDLQLPLAPREAVQLVRAIAQGIQALHSAGNIHGDLKPSNILLTESGVPKVTDFDLASATDLDEYRRGGNLAFMAPEVLLEDDLLPSPLGDVFALGGMLYYFLTGDLPHGKDAQAIVKRHRNRELPEMAQIEHDLGRVCARALSPCPDSRYRSAEAFAEDLGLWLAREPIPWTRPSTVRKTKLLLQRRPIPIIITTLLVMVGVSVVGLLQMAASREMEAERQAIELSKAELEKLKEQSRKTIEGFVKSGAFGNRLQRGPSVFAALAWVDWLSDASVLGDSGPQLAAEERWVSLSDLRHALKTERRSGTLQDGLAAFCMGYTAIELGEYADALEQIHDAEQSVLGGLPESDEMAMALRGLKLIAEYHIAVRDGNPDVTDLRESLEVLAVRLQSVENPHSVATLIRRALQVDLRG